MLPAAEMMKWLKGQGAEFVVVHPDGGMTVYRKSIFSVNTKRVYWARIDLAKVNGGYTREGDTWFLCDAPPKGAEEFKR